jgi:MGT family glycosyltransferase
MGLLQRWLLDTVPGQVSDVEEILGWWNPTVILSDESMWGPTLVVREKHGVPVVAVSPLAGSILPGPDSPSPGFGLGPGRSAPQRIAHRAIEAATIAAAAPLRRGMSALRVRHGLPPLRTNLRSAVAEVPLYLVRGAPEFDYRRCDLPPSVRYVGPLEWRGDAEGGAPGWIAELPRDVPVVFVSEGTMQSRPPVLLPAAAEGLADLDVQVVMATGRNRDPRAIGLGALAPNIRVEAWVSQQHLFPRTDVVVTFGGCGTVFGALSAGVPLVVVPAELDQPDNARRVVETGTGVRLPRRRCNATSLRGCVEKVLASAALRANARRMGEMLARYRGAETAADLVERCARGERSGHAVPTCGSTEGLLPRVASVP